MIYICDRYWRKGVDLIEAVTRDTIIFRKTLAHFQRAEEFAKEFSSLAEKFASKWKERECARNRIASTFHDEQACSRRSYIQKRGELAARIYRSGSCSSKGR